VTAAGDGSWGRRDFFWHNGQQLSLNYQKRNVFGFGLDFAEDRTKTSWGVEFSWLANALIGNTNTFSGLSDADIMTMSISVDRPTFINFLNPNRSFFMNFQFFMQYVIDYEGGPSDKDGNFGAFEDKFSIPTVVFTFFSGYFQDRLAPRTSIVWSPPTGTYGILWGLSYRWSGNFSTSLAMNNFWGTGGTSGTSIRRANFPITQYGDRDLSGLNFRGFTPVLSREVIFLTMRYSW
jgi:hypothetical protein